MNDRLFKVACRDKLNKLAKSPRAPIDKLVFMIMCYLSEESRVFTGKWKTLKNITIMDYEDIIQSLVRLEDAGYIENTGLGDDGQSNYKINLKRLSLQ
jgi:hypothetical protein